MPVLEVEVVGGAPVPGLAARIADAAGSALGHEAGRTWVRLRRLPAEDYAEHGGATPDPLPVFVRLLVADPPTDADRLTELVGAVTTAVADAVDRPADRVHLVVEGGRGRAAFGGRVVGGQ